MIYYRPTDGDPFTTPIRLKPRTCFLMCQLGKPIPEELSLMRQTVEEAFAKNGFGCIDAKGRTTGKDFLLKICEMLLSVPVGIALFHSKIKPGTTQNIFYELGMMQAYGKDTLIIKIPSTDYGPSDLARTEYVPFDEDISRRIDGFCSELDGRARYFLKASDILVNNPLLALDYLRRAYLLSPSEDILAKRDLIMKSPGIESRARDSVEQLAASFEA